MKKERMLSIIALVLAVITLTVGFAAFSNTLTISSSATVTPDSSDFKIRIYGIDEEIATSDLGKIVTDVGSYDSSTTSFPYVSNASANNAVISNGSNSHTISNISATFSGPLEVVQYYFMIKNEGEYDAYLDLDKVKEIYGNKKGTCTASADATESLVSAACEDIALAVFVADEEFNELTSDQLTGSYKIEKNGYVFLGVGVTYQHSSGTRADGDFSVSFDDISLYFSTVEK